MTDPRDRRAASRPDVRRALGSPDEPRGLRPRDAPQRNVRRDRLVNLLGVPTCMDEDLLPRTDDNPRGYWESASLTAFNDRILAAFGSDWSCPPRLDPGWEGIPRSPGCEPSAGLFPRCSRRSNGSGRTRATASPSPSGHLPRRRAAIVLVHRNPLKIAASLGARDGLGKVYALALWERYCACLGVSSLPTLVTDYDRCWRTRLRGAKAFGFPEGVGVATAAVDAESARATSTRGFVRRDTPRSFCDPAVSSNSRASRHHAELAGTHERLAARSFHRAARPRHSSRATASVPREREYRELGEYSARSVSSTSTSRRTYTTSRRDMGTRSTHRARSGTPSSSVRSGAGERTRELRRALFGRSAAVRDAPALVRDLRPSRPTAHATRAAQRLGEPTLRDSSMHRSVSAARSGSSQHRVLRLPRLVVQLPDVVAQSLDLARIGRVDPSSSSAVISTARFWSSTTLVLSSPGPAEAFLLDRDDVERATPMLSIHQPERNTAGPPWSQGARDGERSSRRGFGSLRLACAAPPVAGSLRPLLQRAGPKIVAKSKPSSRSSRCSSRSQAAQ